jgi:hypothetical protein
VTHTPQATDLIAEARSRTVSMQKPNLIDRLADALDAAESRKAITRDNLARVMFASEFDMTWEEGAQQLRPAARHKFVVLADAILASDALLDVQAEKGAEIGKLVKALKEADIAPLHVLNWLDDYAAEIRQSSGGTE